jgi:tetratricopeptide (TPR) repeat protein
MFDARLLVDNSFLLCLIGLLVTGCSSTGEILDDADQLRSQGSYDEAANFYARVLRSHPENSAAQSGLKTAGQYVLGNKLQQFEQYASLGSYEQAYSVYLEAQSYRSRITQDTPVRLTIESRYAETLSKMEKALAQKHYRAVRQSLSAGDPNSAGVSLEQVQPSAPSYNNGSKLFKRSQDDSSTTLAITPDAKGMPMANPDSFITEESFITEDSEPQMDERPPTSQSPALRLTRITGSYLDVSGARYYDFRAGTRVRIIKQNGNAIAEGVVTSIIGNRATVEVQTRRGSNDIGIHDRVVVVER